MNAVVSSLTVILVFFNASGRTVGSPDFIVSSLVLASFDTEMCTEVCCLTDGENECGERIKSQSTCVLVHRWQSFLVSTQSFERLYERSSKEVSP